MGFSGLRTIPKQRVSDAIKATDEFKKDSVDAIESLILFQNSWIRQSRYNKQINYDLVSGKLHPSDIERIMNPTKIKNAYFPAQVKNHPITNPYLKILIGEEFKRRFDYHVKVENEDAVSQKDKERKEHLMQQMQEILSEYVQKPQTDDPSEQKRYEDELQKKLEDLNTYINYEWKDIRELSANQILKYYEQYLQVKPLFNRGWEDALIAAEEIYCVDIVSNEPYIRKCNPLNIYYLMSPDSYKIEDAEYILEEQYLSISKVIDLYYEYLSEKDIDHLESKTSFRTSAYGSIPNYELSDPVFPVSQIGSEINMNYPNYTNTNMLPFDSQNNIRVIRVCWRSMRKVGKLKYFDENGEEQFEFVTDKYKVNKQKGEEIEWMWIGEWWEGTKIANEIYIKIQPRPIQFRSLNNISECKSGYVGSIYKTNSSQAQSLFDVMKPYQYMFNLYSHRTELAFIKAKGKIGTLDLARIPDGWEPDKWMYYAEILGWAVEDSFKEAKKGAATGKIAGNMQNHSPVMDLELGNFIQQHIAMLQYIESQLDKITGISPARRGAMSTEQGLGVTVEAKQASANITEWYFQMHDDVKRRTLELVLETSKYCLRNKNRKFQYINDDTTQQIFEIDGNLINEAEYGLFLRSASEDAETIGILKRATEAAIQTGQVDIIQMLDIFSNTSLASIRRKTEKSIRDKQNLQEQARQEENQIKQDQIKSMQTITREQMDNENLQKQLDRENKLQIEEIRALGFAKETDINQNQIPDVSEAANIALEQSKHTFDVSLKQQELQHKQNTEKYKKDLEEKKLQLEEKKLKTQKEIEELKNKTALQVATKNRNKYSK